MSEFKKESEARIAAIPDNLDLRNTAAAFLQSSISAMYSYNFDWLGRPIIQYPQDIVAIQELIWKVKPDLIIEAGIAHGGSLILSASMLAMLDMCDAIEAGETIDPRASQRKVLGIDIDIRTHNRAAVEIHPMSSRIQMIEASSISRETIEQVENISAKYSRVMVFLDSNHTHSHVLSELKAYAPLTSIGSYCVVFDTVVEDLPGEIIHDRPWGPGDNPKTAVWEYLKINDDFVIDKSIHDKLLLTVAPDGYLKRTR